jgi:hypothetical protein
MIAALSSMEKGAKQHRRDSTTFLVWGNQPKASQLREG